MKTATYSHDVNYLVKLLNGGELLRSVKMIAASWAEKETNADIKEDLLEISNLKRKGSFITYANSLELKLSLAEEKAKEERTAIKRAKRVSAIIETLSGSDIELELSAVISKIDNAPQPETSTDVLDIALMIKRKLDLEAALRTFSAIAELDNYPVSGDAIAEGLRERAGKKKADKKPAKKDVEKETTNSARGLTANIKTKIAKVALLVVLPLSAINPAFASDDNSEELLLKNLECQNKLISYFYALGQPEQSSKKKAYEKCMTEYEHLESKSDAK
jgi:hypothetical protein